MRAYLSIVVGNKSFEGLIVGSTRLNDDPEREIEFIGYFLIDKPC